MRGLPPLLSPPMLPAPQWLQAPGSRSVRPKTSGPSANQTVPLAPPIALPTSKWRSTFRMEEWPAMAFHPSQLQNQRTASPSATSSDENTGLGSTQLVPSVQPMQKGTARLETNVLIGTLSLPSTPSKCAQDCVIMSSSSELLTSFRLQSGVQALGTRPV